MTEGNIRDIHITTNYIYWTDGNENSIGSLDGSTNTILTLNPQLQVTDEYIVEYTVDRVLRRSNLDGSEVTLMYDAALDNTSIDDFVIVTEPVPEPSTFALLIGGLALSSVLLRRRFKS